MRFDVSQFECSRKVKRLGEVSTGLFWPVDTQGLSSKRKLNHAGPLLVAGKAGCLATVICPEENYKDTNHVHLSSPIHS